MIGATLVPKTITIKAKAMPTIKEKYSRATNKLAHYFFFFRTLGCLFASML
jgi:hypothetical protein